MKNAAGKILFTLMSVISTSASAHYLFIMPEHFQTQQNEMLSIAVHNSDSFPASDSAARVSRLDLHLPTGVTGVDLVRDSRRMVGEVAVDTTGHFFATVSTAVSDIKLEPAEFEDYLREESLTHALEWRANNGEADKPGRERYAKYAKTILLAGETDDQFDKVLGLPIEFVPEKSPYLAAAGDMLPVRVLFQGQPAADLEITASWTGANGPEVQQVGRTDTEGRINVPLAANGAWRLHAILMERRDGKEVDWESHWGILTFEVP